jgi:hypothetical protein
MLTLFTGFQLFPDSLRNEYFNQPGLIRAAIGYYSFCTYKNSK